MYDAFWSNVSRAENAAWTIVAVYGALIAGVGLAQSILTIAGAAFVLIVFGYIGSCLSVSANLWFRRNLTLIGRIETNFLRESDYGSLIPRNYQKPRKFWTIEYWTLLIFALPIISILIGLILVTPREAQKPIGLFGLPVGAFIWSTILAGFALTVTYSYIQSCNYSSFLEATRRKGQYEHLKHTVRV